MRKIDFDIFTQSCHTPIDRIKEHIFIKIVFRIELFFLKFSPKRLCNVQMRRIWRKKENIQSSILPVGHALRHSFRLMYTRIIQYNKCLFLNLKGKILQKLQYKFGINITFGCFPSALTFSIDKPKAVNFIGLFGKNANILIRKLAAVGNVTLTTDVSFITIIKVYFIFHIQLFKLSQFFALKFIMFRQRLSLITTPYAFISSAKL